MENPQIIHFNRVFHYFHHPFWGTPIFGNTHMEILCNQHLDIKKKERCCSCVIFFLKRSASKLKTLFFGGLGGKVIFLSSLGREDEYSRSNRILPKKLNNKHAFYPPAFRYTKVTWSTLHIQMQTDTSTNHHTGPSLHRQVRVAPVQKVRSSMALDVVNGVVDVRFVASWNHFATVPLRALHVCFVLLRA